jgi:hypothetical protein
MLDWRVKLKKYIKGHRRKISTKKKKDAIWNDNIEIKGLFWMDFLVQVSRKEERKSRSQHIIVFPVTHATLEGRAHCEISNGIRCFINPKSRSQHAVVASFTCWLVYYTHRLIFACINPNLSWHQIYPPIPNCSKSIKFIFILTNQVSTKYKKVFSDIARSLCLDN